MRLGKCIFIGLFGVFLAVVLCATTRALAIDTPAVLPEGIRTAVIRFGNYDGLNEYYTEEGSLRYLSDKNSFELSVSELARIDARVNDLKEILNEFGHSDLGDQLHLGQISVDADPSVRYFAAAGAIGITKKWTLGLAVPVIFYENTIAIQQSGSNLDAIQAQISGVNEELDNGFREIRAALESDIRVGVNSFLTSRGYDSLSNRSEEFIGDLQLFSMYQLGASPELQHSMQFFLGLPTGPKPDPDDLTDLENFGRYTLKVGWVGKRPFWNKSDLLFSASFSWVPEDNMVKRVPVNENDALPDENQKYALSADIGDVLNAGVAISRAWSQEIYFAGGYSYEYKMADSYSGAPDGRERFLERGTEKSAHLAKFEAGYSTVQGYFKKKFAAPMIVAYEFTQTLAGVNVENQNRHELTLSLFF